jgi:hypothetical protein
VRLFGPASIIKEHYTIGNVTRFAKDSDLPLVERVVIVSQGQPPDLLPGWQPLAS